MTRLAVIGLPACCKNVAGRLQHTTPARYAAAIVGGAGAVPLMIPPVGELAVALLDRLDGLLLPGSPSNIEPARYGVAEDQTPGLHDPLRDATSLPLIHEALARGLPLLGICRGHQELNVALGGTLHQRVQELPGRFDHRGDPSSEEACYAPAHSVRLSGHLAALLGNDEITVNSVHQQAIDRLAPGLVVEAEAPDGTIEAVRVRDAPGFAFGLQWHPEWEYGAFADRVSIFRAFGDACRAWVASC